MEAIQTGKGQMVKGKRLVTMTLPSVSTRGDLKALARARVADGSRTYDHLAASLEAEEYLLSYQKPDEQKPTEEDFGNLVLCHP